MELRNKDGLTEKEFLERYNPGDYERPSVTVDMLLFTVDNKKQDDYRKLPEKELKLLLIKRKDHPYIGKWAIPGGFVDINEAIETAVYRELKEETNIENVYMEQLYTFGDEEDGQYGKEKRDPRMRVISVSHMALVSKEGLKPVAGDDAEDVAWFTVKKQEVSCDSNERVYNLILESQEKDVTIGYLVIDRFVKNGIITTTETHIEPLYWSKDQLAFDHYKIVNLAIDRLRNKIEYTPIVFNLMPPKFTLTSLQQVYETILDKPYTPANFRRKVSKYVEELDDVLMGAGHRPAKLFKYNGEI